MSDFKFLVQQIHKQKHDITWELVRDLNYDINKFASIPGVINGTRATCLGNAISIGDLELIRACLKRGADPNLGYIVHATKTTFRNEHPMITAASKDGDLAFEILKELLAAGSTPTKDDINKMSHEAVWPLSLKCLEWCFEHGADANYTPYTNAQSLFITLCRRWDERRHEEYLAAVALLLKNGADANIEWKDAEDVERAPGYYGWKLHIHKGSFRCSKSEVETIIGKIETMINN